MNTQTKPDYTQTWLFKAVENVMNGNCSFNSYSHIDGERIYANTHLGKGLVVSSAFHLQGDTLGVSTVINANVNKRKLAQVAQKYASITFGELTAPIRWDGLLKIATLYVNLNKPSVDDPDVLKNFGASYFAIIKDVVDILEDGQ